MIDRMLTSSARALLTGLVDYAGLFPPAALSMQAAVEQYARDKAGEHEWMLGRFICPVARLEEFSRLAAPLMPGTHGTSGYREHARGEPWSLSALIDTKTPEDLRRALSAIAAFNDRHAQEDQGRAVIDCLELKAADVGFIDAAVETIPPELYPFFELPAGVDPRGFVAALAGQRAAAKIRTGGVTPDLFPSPEHVADFLLACVAAEVPFKATAGLHHACRGPYRLTYEPDSPSGVMHGFLNLFAAAVFARVARLSRDEVAQLLTETNPSVLVFSEQGLSWRGHAAQTAQIAKVRESFALSFGSCSFDEPVQELSALGLI